MEPMTEYKTKDLAEAAVLLTKNRPILRVDRVNGRCWFIFGGRDECGVIIDDFLFGECLVNARTFYESTNKLKNRIFSGG